MLLGLAYWLTFLSISISMSEWNSVVPTFGALMVFPVNMPNQVIQSNQRISFKQPFWGVRSFGGFWAVLASHYCMNGSLLGSDDRGRFYASGICCTVPEPQSVPELQSFSCMQFPLVFFMGSWKIAHTFHVNHRPALVQLTDHGRLQNFFENNIMVLTTSFFTKGTPEVICCSVLADHCF